MGWVGFDLTVSNPDALILALWIGFAYFLWRYFQYFMSEGLGRFILAFHNSQDKRCNKTIGELVVEKNPNLKGHNFEKDYSLYVANNWKIQHPIGNNEPLVNIEIDPRKLKKCKFCSYFEFLIINSAASDYMLPFILAFLIFIYYWFF